MFSDLDSYKTITYDNRKMKTTVTNRAEEFASWYLTPNVNLLFSSKKYGKKRNMVIEFIFIKNEKVINKHQMFNKENFVFPFTIPDVDFDALAICGIFQTSASYFHIGLDCEDIKFAYRYFKEMEAGSKYEFGSFIPYERGYRFFPNTHFME